MKLNRINEQLARLTSMVEGWQNGVRPSAIERDLALETLRRLYDEVLDLECGGVIKEPLSDAQIPVAVVATTVTKCERVEAMGECVDIKTEDKVAVETIAKSNEQAESVVEPSPAVDDTAMLIDIDALLGISRDDEQDTPLTETSVAVAVPNTDVAESRSEPNEPNAVVEQKQSAEFDVNDLPKRRKSNRRMLSLYDDAATTYPSAEAVSESKVEATTTNVADDVVADALAEESQSEPMPAVEPVEEVAQPIEKPLIVESIHPEPISQPVEPKAQAAEPKAQAAEQSQPQSVVIPAEPKAQRVAQPIQPAMQPRLGDVLRENVTVLADAMFDDSQAVNAVTRISDLRKAIGLNDKFLMIRDLFDGNAQRYEDTITTLNEFNDLDECIIYISENFVWDPASEGAKLLMSLIERKLS